MQGFINFPMVSGPAFALGGWCRLAGAGAPVRIRLELWKERHVRSGVWGRDGLREGHSSVIICTETNTAETTPGLGQEVASLPLHGDDDGLSALRVAPKLSRG